MGVWYYEQNQARFGPVDLPFLKTLIEQGKVHRHNLVWREGLPQWTAAAEIPELFAPATTNELGDIPEASAASRSELGYFAGTLPSRAQQTLKGHAPPSGDVGTWPLDDAMLAQWKDATAIRRKIFGAAQLMRLVFVLSLLGAIVTLCIGVITFLTGSQRQQSESLVMLGVSVFYAVIATLYFFLYRYTMRSHFWAPLTFAILMGIGILGILGTGVIDLLNGGRGEAMMIGVFGSILPVIFLFVAIRGMTAIPQYRRSPAWCQELIAAAKL